jgi:hypothetical protein
MFERVLMTEMLITTIAVVAIIAILGFGVAGHGTVEVVAAMLALFLGAAGVIALMRHLLKDL